MDVAQLAMVSSLEGVLQQHHATASLKRLRERISQHVPSFRWLIIMQWKGKSSITNVSVHPFLKCEELDSGWNGSHIVVCVHIYQTLMT